MSRRRKAVITAIFTYGQSGLGMLLGLVVTRIVLHRLGRDLYGIWLSSGALLAYAGFADLGVLGVLPWMIAEADGERDDERIRSLMAHGFTFAVFAAFAFASITFGLWRFYPSILHLTATDRAELGPPLFLLIGLTASAFPFRLFSALLTGRQDATYLGISGLLQVLMTSTLTLVLILKGFGLMGLALGAGLPPLLIAIAALFRARFAFADIVRGWSRPTWKLLRKLAVDGFGVWLISFGYTMAAASDPVILSFVGLRDTVSNFSVSTRLGLTLTQFAWILPDSALVGLAQLSTEGTKARVREVALAILLLNLLVGGAVATAVLASNGAFVRLWVGADYFLGARFNAILAINAVLACLIHGLGSIAAVLGKRVEMGLALLANGFAHIVVATLLGQRFGAYGVLIGTFVSGSITCLPIAFVQLRRVLDTSAGDIGRILTGWCARYLAPGILAATWGWYAASRSLAIVVPVCAAVGYLYLLSMRSFYSNLPLGERVGSLLKRLGLMT